MPPASIGSGEKEELRTAIEKKEDSPKGGSSSKKEGIEIRSEFQFIRF